MNEIVCACCKEQKPDTEFANSSSKKNGKQSYCRPCATAARRKSPYKRNVSVERKAQMKYKYGLTLEAFEELWEAQDGACAICKKKLQTNNRGVSIDHNHETGFVRGLLCNPCNTGLGLLRDSISLLNSAVSYLEERGSYG